MIEIDGNHLDIRSLVSVARHGEEVEISPQGVENIRKSRKVLETILQSNQAVYGINTGFGIFSEKRIPVEDSKHLSRNLILSHAVAVGEPLPTEVVRAAMLVRANTLVKGYSGVREEVVQTLIEMLNKKSAPWYLNRVRWVLGGT